MAQTTNYVALTAVTVAVGLAAYAVYFDYKRRNDVEFRKKLRPSSVFSSSRDSHFNRKGEKTRSKDRAGIQGGPRRPRRQ